MRLLISPYPQSGKTHLKINYSRLWITNGFALALVALSALNVSLAPAAAKNLPQVSPYNGRTYGTPSLPNSQDSHQIKSKSLHERHIDSPIVRKDGTSRANHMPELSDDVYSNYDTDYSNRWLNPNDYAFLFAIRLTDTEDYDEAAGLRSYFS